MTALEKSDFDAIVLGTGLPESILAGALSRVKQHVLHLDANPYYGSRWATLTLKELSEWINGHDVIGGPPSWKSTSRTSGVSEPGRPGTTGWCEGGHAAQTPKPEQLFDSDVIRVDLPQLREFSSDIEVVAPDVVHGEPSSFVASLHPSLHPLADHARDYNIDLAPALMHCRGPLVRTLIKSGVGRYLEFRNLQSTHLQLGEELVAVPCSQADIFKNRTMSLAEKRLLTKLLKFCMQYGNVEAPNGHVPGDRLARDAESIPLFADFVSARGLSKHLEHFIVFTLAQASWDQRDTASTHASATSAAEPPEAGLSHQVAGDDIHHTRSLGLTTWEGIARVRRHLVSLGVYGRTAFLYPLYGVSELTQAFCRLCAVYEGIYILHRGVSAVLLSPNGSTLVGVEDSTGQQFRSRMAVVPIDSAPTEWYRPEIRGDPCDADTPAHDKDSKKEPAVGIARCVCILDGPLIRPGMGVTARTDSRDDASSDSDSASDDEPSGGGGGGPGDGPVSEGPILITIPPNEMTLGAQGSFSGPIAPVSVLQLDHSTHSCPTGKYMLHLAMTWMVSDESSPAPASSSAARKVLEPVLNALLNNARRRSEQEHPNLREADDSLTLPSPSVPVADPVPSLSVPPPDETHSTPPTSTNHTPMSEAGTQRENPLPSSEPPAMHPDTVVATPRILFGMYYMQSVTDHHGLDGIDLQRVPSNVVITPRPGGPLLVGRREGHSASTISRGKGIPAPNPSATEGSSTENDACEDLAAPNKPRDGGAAHSRPAPHLEHEASEITDRSASFAFNSLSFADAAVDQAEGAFWHLVDTIQRDQWFAGRVPWQSTLPGVVPSSEDDTPVGDSRPAAGENQHDDATPALEGSPTPGPEAEAEEEEEEPDILDFLPRAPDPEEVWEQQERDGDDPSAPEE